MPTSAAVAFVDFHRSRDRYSFQRNSCFGDMNRIYMTDSTPLMDVMEWYPNYVQPTTTDYGTSATGLSEAVDFFNTLGMYAGMFSLSPINSVMASVADNPADRLITGFMSLRDFQEGNQPILGGNNPAYNAIDKRIRYTLSQARFYINTMGSFGFHGANSGGEGNTLYLPTNLDAIAIWLLAFGTPEDFNGCWAQPAIGRDESTLSGYIRNSSSTNRKDRVRELKGYTVAQWDGMCYWMHAWLLNRPAHLADRLGRLTIQQFGDRLTQAVNAARSAEAKAEAINSTFDQLRDLYLA